MPATLNSIVGVLCGLFFVTRDVFFLCGSDYTWTLFLGIITAIFVIGMIALTSFRVIPLVPGTCLIATSIFHFLGRFLQNKLLFGIGLMFSVTLLIYFVTNRCLGKR